MKRLQRNALLAFLLSAVFLHANPVVRTIDKRNHSEETNYYLCFAAKPIALADKSPGHAFVVFGKEDPQKKQSTAEAWGQYPKDGEKTVIGILPGGIANEALKGNTGNLLGSLRGTATFAPDYDPHAPAFEDDEWEMNKSL